MTPKCSFQTSIDKNMLVDVVGAFHVPERQHHGETTGRDWHHLKRIKHLWGLPSAPIWFKVGDREGPLCWGLHCISFILLKEEAETNADDVSKPLISITFFIRSWKGTRMGQCSAVMSSKPVHYQTRHGCMEPSSSQEMKFVRSCCWGYNSVL